MSGVLSRTTKSNLVIGIDLGTTNSCVAVYAEGENVVYENNAGSRITPSFVLLSKEGGIHVGQVAKKRAKKEPSNEIKRLVGRKFDDEKIQKSLPYYPFQVVGDSDNDPKVVVKQRNKTVTKTPQQLYTLLLQQLKKDIELKLGATIDKAVITVPAYFNVSQREVTLAAAKDAGFTVLKLLNEPTAAALTYYFKRKRQPESYSLVYDLGGGTFDVAVLKRTMDNIEILSVDGDTHLGGQDLDNLIVDHICQILQSKYNYDPKLDKTNMRRLQAKCEKAKKDLSTDTKTEITLVNFVKNTDVVDIELIRDQFEKLSEEKIEQTIKIMDNCLQISGIAKSNIKEIILSGGSTRIPKIRERVSKYFDGKELNHLNNPDESVAEGAALQAAMLSSDNTQRIDVIKLVDVVPLSIGESDFVDKMVFIIKRNTQIPAEGSCNLSTLKNNQENMWIGVYEGERPNVKKNRFLGEFVISNLTPAPPGQCNATLTMSIDKNGILTARAKEHFRDNVKELKIEYSRSSRSDKEVRNAVKDAEDNKRDDELFLQFAKVKSYCLNYCESVTYNIESQNLLEDYQSHYVLCKEIQNLVKGLNQENMDKVKALVRQIREKCEPIVQKHNFSLMPEMY